MFSLMSYGVGSRLWGMWSGGSSICTLAAYGSGRGDPELCKPPAPCSRSRPDVAGDCSRRGSLPSARLRPSSSKGAVPRQPEIGSPCPEVRLGLTSFWWEIRTCRQDCIFQDRGPGDRSVRLFFFTPEQIRRGSDPRTDVRPAGVLKKKNSRSRHGEARPGSARSGKSRTFASQRQPQWPCMSNSPCECMPLTC